MTYRGHVKNGTVVLDPPAELPEGAAVEVNVVPHATSESAPNGRPPISSIQELRGQDVGDDDPFGPEFERTLREWRSGPWRAAPQEPLE